MKILNSFDSDLLGATKLANPEERELWTREHQYAVLQNFEASLASIYEPAGIELIAAEAVKRCAGGLCFTETLEAVEADLRRLGKLRAYDKRIVQPVAAPPAPEPTAEEIAEQAENAKTDKFIALCEQVYADLGLDSNGLWHGGGISGVEISAKCAANPEYQRAYAHVKKYDVARGYGQTLNPPVRAEAPALLKQFAKQVNEHMRLGNGTPKAVRGEVTLKLRNDNEVKYPRLEFLELAEKAASFNLID